MNLTQQINKLQGTKFILFFNLLGRWPMKVVISGLILFLVLQIPRDTNLTLSQTRPVIFLTAFLLSGIGLWGIGTAGLSGWRGYRQSAWRMALRSVGWLGILGSFIGVGLMMIGSPEAMPISGKARAVESIVPLVIGLQAAFLFSPDDEPGLEVLLTCPRPISWLLMERLFFLFLAQAVVALIGGVVSQDTAGTWDWGIFVARWLSPSLLFSGIAVFTTLRSRNPAFGAAVTGMVWFAFGFLGAALLPGVPTVWPLSLVQPFLWAVHGYLQPEMLPIGDYWLNRIVVGGLGISLLMKSVFQLHNEEWVLFGGKVKLNAPSSEG